MAARGLGKGLDALIPKSVTKAAPAETQVKEPVGTEKETIVKITKVEPNREQPRKIFDEEKLQQLSDSIKQFGLLQPILVQYHKEEDYYEIVAGERRWRASKLAGLKEVPVIIKEFTEQEKYEIAIVENIQREDLNPIEEALAYKKLADEFKLKQDEIAEKVSKSRVAVSNSMRLLKLDDKVQQMIVDNELSTGHARCLISIEDKEAQVALAEKIKAENLSVRDAEKLVKNYGLPKKEKPVKKTDESLLLVYKNLEEKLKSTLGTKVSIVPKEDGAGKLEIEFFSHDELERITDVLLKK